MFKIQGQDAHCQSHNRWKEGHRLLYLSQLTHQGLNGKSGIFWLRCAITCVRAWVSFHIRSLEKYDERKKIFEESALSHFWRHGRRGASQGHLALCFLTKRGGHGMKGVKLGESDCSDVSPPTPQVTYVQRSPLFCAPGLFLL